LKGEIPDKRGFFYKMVKKEIKKETQRKLKQSGGQEVKKIEKKEKVVKKKIKKASKAKIEKARTMEELLEATGYELAGFKKGQMVRGKLTSISNKSAYIDIGGKTDAVVMGKEFLAVKDYMVGLNLGDEVEVQVRSLEDDKGQILVSLRGAASGFGWDFFEEKMKRESEVLVYAREENRGGAVVVAPFGFFGFIPGSQIGGKYDQDPEKMIGKKVRCKVLEVDSAKNRLVFSERLVSEPGVVKDEEKAADELAIGKSFEAEVVRVEPFGLFVKIEMGKIVLEGLVHISEVSWEKVEQISKFFKIRDKIKVQLINKEGGRLQFSVKRLLPDPWEGIDKRYSMDAEYEGEVVKLANFGALVRLEAGVEGLIHISKLAGEEKLNVGDKVKVYVETMDVERRKISLGLVDSKKTVIYK
jgi:small subunit ribosomal protein S1